MDTKAQKGSNALSITAIECWIINLSKKAKLRNHGTIEKVKIKISIECIPLMIDLQMRQYFTWIKTKFPIHSIWFTIDRNMEEYNWELSIWVDRKEYKVITEVC